jgi:hypothetical protein
LLFARGKAEGRNGGAERSENSMAGVIKSGSERRQKILSATGFADVVLE